MALLYQEIMRVPGLTGTARQRQEQLFNRLYPGQKYSASYNQNIDLLKQVQSGNYGQTQTPQAPAVDPIALMTDQALSSIKNLPAKSFEEQYGTSDAYVRAQDPLTNASIAERQVNGTTNAELHRTEFANRGLFRSGARGVAEGDLALTTSKNEQSMRDQLYATRESELKNDYATMQKNYEDALRTGSTYTAPKQVDYTQTPQQSYTPVQTAGDRYSVFSAGENQNPNQSKYAQAYKSWYENKFKKTRPDVSYNIY